MSETPGLRLETHRSILSPVAIVALACLVLAPSSLAQQRPAPSAPPAKSAPAAEKPLPGLDLSSIDLSADPCTDMYSYACGNFNANHPIPADQPDVDPFYVLYNVNTQALNAILTKSAVPSPTRTPDEQKIGDFFNACMDTTAIDAAGLKPIQPLLDKIAALGNPADRAQLAALIGKLQRIGVDAFFRYGEQQDYKDAAKQIAFIQQGGLGLPEKDYYLRTGDKDAQIRAQYVAHVAKMLTLAGTTPARPRRTPPTSWPWRPPSPRPPSESSTCASPRRPITCSPSPRFRPPCPASASPALKTPSTLRTSPRSTTPRPTSGPN